MNDLQHLLNLDRSLPTLAVMILFLNLNSVRLHLILDVVKWVEGWGSRKKSQSRASKLKQGENLEPSGRREDCLQCIQASHGYLSLAPFNQYRTCLSHAIKALYRCFGHETRNPINERLQVLSRNVRIMSQAASCQ